LIHAHAHTPFVEDLGLSVRFQAAVVSVSRIVLLTKDLLANLTMLRDEGVIEISQSAFDQAVVVESSEVEMTGLYLGREGDVPRTPDGTAVPLEQMTPAHGPDTPFPIGQTRVRFVWNDGPYPPQLRR
jgi:hypothetical protein